MNDSKNISSETEKESFIFRLASYIVTLSLAIPIYFLMILINKVTIIGKEKITGAKLPFLFVSNHVTMLDDFFIGPLLFLPKGLWNFNFIPYHTPEQKNFYKGPIVSWIMDHVKCLPLTRGKGIFQPGMQRIIAKIKLGGCVQIYPEGTRTRTGDLGKAKPGIGRIIYATRCGVIPCYHAGLDKVLPIGSKIPKFGKKIDLIVGDPMNLQKFFEMEDNAGTWQKISEEIIAEIAKLRDKLYEKK